MNKKLPMAAAIFAVLFLIFGILDFTQCMNALNVFVMKEQQVKIMEDQLVQAEKTQDFKPSELQKEYLKAFKEYKVTP